MYSRPLNYESSGQDQVPFWTRAGPGRPPQSAIPPGGARTWPGPRSPAGPRTAQHFVHYSKMVSILRPGEELLSERCPIWSKPADGQNTSQSADAIPETGG